MGMSESKIETKDSFQEMKSKHFTNEKIWKKYPTLTWETPKFNRKTRKSEVEEIIASWEL